MTAGGRTQIEQFKRQVEAKVKAALEEFAQGKLSREQFQTVYAHYDSQLQLAEAALAEQQPLPPEAQAGATIAILEAHRGKAVGLLIYHNQSSALIDTLGTFTVSGELLKPILKDFTLALEGRLNLDRRVEKVDAGQWVLLTVGKYTSVLTLFQNEPAQRQVREIERLHHDFEIANAYFLAASRVDAAQLAYPFFVFIQQKLKRKG